MAHRNMLALNRLALHEVYKVLTIKNSQHNNTAQQFTIGFQVDVRIDKN